MTPEARARRTTGTAIPWDRWVAEALTNTRPWEALGISRTSWYRRHRWTLGPLEEARKAALGMQESRT